MAQNIETIFDYESEDGKKGVLGIDPDARLYWNGQLVVTEQKIRLSWWVNLAVVVGGFSTLLIAVFTILLYFK